MASIVKIEVKESVAALKKLFPKAPNHHRPRLKMLLLIAGEHLHINSLLAAKTGASQRSILRWKRDYSTGGLPALLADKRGGDYRSSIDEAAKKKLEAKLKEPKGAFTSFGQAQTWIKEELGVEMNYHAVNKYLKRNFGARLKVGRKSHVKKDESAVAVFKKPGRDSGTY